MSESYETKRYGADKIALLGLFIVALVIARFIIASSSAIVLSGPIKLDYSGLSVSMPMGNGWQSEKQWKFQNNSFDLSSVFNPGSGSVTALVQCRYLLAVEMSGAEARLKQKASAVGGEIAETGRGRLDKLTVDWAHIKKPKTLFDMFFGTVRLPNNRQFDIEVHQATGDSKFAEQVFKRIAESLEFEDNQLLAAGSKIIGEIKSKGLESFLKKEVRETFFLIKDSRRHTTGFTMDLLGCSFARLQNEGEATEVDAEGQSNIEGASFYYIRDRYNQEQATLFKSDNSFDEFTWKSETSGPRGRSGVEIVLERDGIMTVKRFNAATREKIYRPGPAAIPEMFLEFTLSELLESDKKEIIVDVIDSEGKITPTLISRIEGKDKTIEEEEAVYLLSLELLDGREFSEQVSLDRQKHISRILLRQNNIYILERSSAEDVSRQFPEHSEYILQKNKMQGQNEPEH